MKKKIIIIGSLLAVMVLSLTVTGAMAYLMAKDHVSNAVSIGNSEIEIEEVFENPDIKVIEDPDDEPTVITKQVIVTNMGLNYSSVRVKAEFSSNEVMNWAVPDYNTANWHYSGVFWYYNTPLAPGEQTEPLFNKVTCTPHSDAEVADFDIYVYAESRNIDSTSTNTEEVW